MDYKWLLFGFDGRIGRARYCLAVLIILGCMIVALTLLAAVAVIFDLHGPLAIDIIGISASIQFTDDDIPAKASLFPEVATIPLTIVFAWCYAAASIKRLHDRDKSGWWIVPFIVASGLYGQFGAWLGGSWAAVALGRAVYIAFAWGLVEICYLRGTRGPNRFGADPLTPRNTGPRWDQHAELEFVPRSAGPSAGA